MTGRRFSRDGVPLPGSGWGWYNQTTYGGVLLIPATGNERILWLALIVLVLSYLAGAWLNRRRGKAIGHWLQGGLASLGGKPAWKVTRSLSTGAEVTVFDAARPFQQVQASYYLMTREIMPLWGIELLRGKRDLLAIRANLRVQPVAEYELVPLQGKLRTLLDEKAGEQPWQWQEMPAGLGLATRGTPSRVTVQGDQLVRQAPWSVHRAPLAAPEPAEPEGLCEAGGFRDGPRGGIPPQR